MKAKVKMDSGKMKAAFAKHIEKIVFGVVGLGFVWMVHAATKVERYTHARRTGESFQRRAAAFADTRIHRRSEEPGELGACTKFRRQHRPLTRSWRALAGRHSSRPTKNAQRRKQAQVFAPTAMRAQAGVGAIATIADERTRLIRERDA